MAIADNPYADKQHLAQLEARLKKAPPTDFDNLRALLRGHWRAAEALGYPVPPPAKVLDVGCGIGDSVQVLLEQGFDAFGIDVLEYWGADFGQFWQARARPTGAHLSRLRVVDVDAYRLPFPDAYFDFAFSDQVFEHVFNYETAFRQIARVLKPGAISVHVFPGPNTLVEDHVNVPVPVLCRFKPYLAMWAILGRRSSAQSGLDWKETLELNVDTMKFCQYPSKRSLRAVAARAGVEIDFIEPLALRAREYGRVAQLLRRVPASLRPACAQLASLVAQRTMVVKGGGSRGISPGGSSAD